MSDSITCSVCQHEIEEQYCPNCGQQYNSGKITALSTLGDLLANLFSLERSVAAVCLKLIWNPATIVSNYLNGFKKYYPSPGKILFVALTIAGLHVAFIDKNLLGISLELKNVNAQITFFLMFTPFLATISKLAFFRRTHGFIKHWISVIYLTSANLIVLTVLNDTLYFAFDYDTGAMMGVYFFLLFFIQDARVHAHGNTKRIALHAFLELLIFIGLSALILYLNYLKNPDSFSIE